MDTLLKIVQTVNLYLSDYILIIMLLGCGIYFTIRTRFLPVRLFPEMLRISAQRKNSFHWSLAAP